MISYLPIALLALVGCACAVWLTGRVRAYALRVHMIDAINARGSHVEPTPRGGGLAIVISACGAIGLAALLGIVPRGAAGGLVGGGLIVAMAGWLDDHGHVAPLVRLAAQFTGAAVVVWAIGVLPLAGFFPFWQYIGSIFAVFLTLFYLVWMTNLFNFMDGIDGIAAGEAFVVTAGGTILAAVAGLATPALIAPPLLVGAATLGFLRWNWPPARIFMGDVSSGFLGFSLGSLSLIAGEAMPELAWGWIALCGAFIADATVTLLRRLLRGERVFEAHRSHAYQRCSRLLGEHRSVTIAVLSITCCWCFPIAYCIVVKRVAPFAGVAMVFISLAAMALLAGAGASEDKEQR